MLVKQFIICLSFCFCLFFGAYGQGTKGRYSLGIGLVSIGKEARFVEYDSKPVVLYKDSARTVVYTKLVLAQTNCPTCMECAEPPATYQGKIQPFICGAGQGMQFICTKATKKYNELIIDKAGTRAYVDSRQTIFYSWNAYMQRQARQGEYFEFVRQWDKSVLYDKPYGLHTLPKPDKNLLVGLRLPADIDYLRFYPVLIKGYWMKLRIVDGQKTIGYCWFVWRNEREWLHGFKFRTD